MIEAMESAVTMEIDVTRAFDVSCRCMGLSLLDWLECQFDVRTVMSKEKVQLVVQLLIWLLV